MPSTFCDFSISLLSLLLVAIPTTYSRVSDDNDDDFAVDVLFQRSTVSTPHHHDPITR